MQVNGGQIGNQTAGNPIWPGTLFTGPILGGNVQSSDGSGNLAGLGETTGQANVGFVQMSQTGTISQTGNATLPSAIVIPAQSQILEFQAMVTTAWTAGNTTFGIGTTGNSTFFTAAGAIQGNATGLIAGSTINPGTSATAIANWDNVGNQDVQLVFTSGNLTGAGAATVTVTYLQGINNSA